LCSANDQIVTQFTKLPFFWKSIAHVAITLNGSAARGDRFHITILQCKIGFVFFGAVPHSRFDWLPISHSVAENLGRSLFEKDRSISDWQVIATVAPMK